MNLYIKQLDETTPLPIRGSEHSAGIDFYCPERVKIYDDKPYVLGLGFEIEIPEGHYGLLALRSSMGKRGLFIPMGVGIIDSDYRGELAVVVRSIEGVVQLEKWERICQLIISPYTRVGCMVVDELSSTTRGSGGFGSTGR